MSAKSCKIVTKEMIKHLNEIALWNNTKKSEKQTALNNVIEKLQHNELIFITEIYLK